jgi:hypothetical protein
MTREEAIREINDVFEPAFANYIIMALSQPEIIRCKDCEYWGEFPDYHSFCLDGAKSYDPEGFCRFARRREK